LKIDAKLKAVGRHIFCKIFSISEFT